MYKISFNVSHINLSKVISHIISVPDKRSSIALLAYVQVQACADSHIIFTASNMDVSITYTIKGKVDAPGNFLISAFMLHDITKKISGEVFFKAQDDKKINISVGSTSFNLLMLPTTDLPLVDNKDLVNTFSMSTKDLIYLLNKTKCSISSESIRYNISGVYISLTKKSIVAVATDMHRLAYAASSIQVNYSDSVSYILPKKTVFEIIKLNSQEVSVSFPEKDLLNRIKISTPEISITSKLISSEFPDYKHIIGAKYNKTLRVDLADFINAIEKVSVIYNDKARAIKISINDHGICLYGMNPDASTAEDSVSYESYTGEAITIFFNYSYLLEILSNLSGQIIEIFLLDSSASVCFKNIDDDSLMYIVMPISENEVI